MFNITKQSLKSYFAYASIDFKKTMIIGTIISSCVFLLQLVIVLITSLAGNTSSSSNGGMLTTSYGMLTISFLIATFTDTANGHMKNMFRFPINRSTYAVGILIYILVAPIAIIAVVSLLQVLESLTYSLLSAVIGNLEYLNNLTAVSYLEGILPTYALTVYALSFLYMLSMYFHRFKWPFAIGLVVLIVLYNMLWQFRDFFNRAFLYPFTLSNIPAFMLCTLSLSLVFHALAYAPLKAMEVK